VKTSPISSRVHFEVAWFRQSDGMRVSVGDFGSGVMTPLNIGPFVGVESDLRHSSGRASTTWYRLTGCWKCSAEQIDALVGIEEYLSGRPAADDEHDALTCPVHESSRAAGLILSRAL
jgi:hypothetical protein